MDGLFPDEFSNLVELRVPSIELVVSRILHGDNDKGTPYPTEPEIRQRIGEGRAELRLAHICFFLEQADTEFWHVFYARGRSGVMRLVSASWSKGWYLSAANVGYLDEWRNGGCVVSQDF